MLVHLGLAASGALTLVLTNLDNLAVLIALLLTTGRRPALGGFLAAQAVVLSLALLVAEGVEATFAGWVGYLGVIPLGLGLWGLAQQWKADTDDDAPRRVKATVMACFLLFLSLSTDSFAAFAPLIADTRQVLRVSLLLGAALAAAALAGLGLMLASGARAQSGWLQRLERLGPYAMIAVGLYVLANTGTDTV